MIIEYNFKNIAKTVEYNLADSYKLRLDYNTGDIVDASDSKFAYNNDPSDMYKYSNIITVDNPLLSAWCYERFIKEAIPAESEEINEIVNGYNLIVTEDGENYSFDLEEVVTYNNSVADISLAIDGATIDQSIKDALKNVLSLLDK